MWKVLIISCFWILPIDQSKDWLANLIIEARDRPIIGIIGIGIGLSVFLEKLVSVSVCYSNAKIGIGKVKKFENR